MSEKITTNIVLLKKMDPKITLFHLSNNNYDKEIPKLVQKMRSKEMYQYRCVIFFEYDKINKISSIFTNNKDAFYELKTILQDWKYNELIMDKNHIIFKQYLSELIAQRLRNHFDRMIVDGFDEIFTATNYNVKSEKDKFIDFYKGFQYKFISLADNIAIIINPKSRYFSRLNLREYLNSGKELEGIDVIEICPNSECIEYLNPLSLCQYSKKSKVIGTIGDNLFLDYDKIPSTKKEGEKNIYDFQREKCDKIIDRISDSPPIITMPKQNITYYYPLERLRKVPSTEDNPELTKKIVVEPDVKYRNIEESLEYIDNVATEEIKILTTEMVNDSYPFIKTEQFHNPNYIINEFSYNNNPFEVLKNGKVLLKDEKISNSKSFKSILEPRKEILLHFISKSRIFTESLQDKAKKYFDDFEKLFNCGITYKFSVFSNFDDVVKDKIENTLFIILKNSTDDNRDIISFLVENQIKFYSFQLSTILKMEIVKKDNLFTIMYHKLFEPYYKLLIETGTKFKNIIGVSLQYNDGYSFALLDFDIYGKLKKGFYYSGDKYDGTPKIKSALNEIVNENSLILVNGEPDLQLKEILLDIDHIFVSENSIIRLFKKSKYDDALAVKAGTSIKLNGEWFTVGYDLNTQGTQQTIKIKNTNFDDDVFDDIAKLCYQLSKYHIGFTENALKLPFPIHFASNTIRKMNTLELKKRLITFDYPLYL